MTEKVKVSVSLLAVGHTGRNCLRMSEQDEEPEPEPGNSSRARISQMRARVGRIEHDIADSRDEVRDVLNRAMTEMRNAQEHATSQTNDRFEEIQDAMTEISISVNERLTRMSSNRGVQEPHAAQVQESAQEQDAAQAPVARADGPTSDVDKNTQLDLLRTKYGKLHATPERMVTPDNRGFQRTHIPELRVLSDIWAAQTIIAKIAHEIDKPQLTEIDRQRLREDLTTCVEAVHKIIRNRRDVMTIERLYDAPTAERYELLKRIAKNNTIDRELLLLTAEQHATMNRYPSTRGRGQRGGDSAHGGSTTTTRTGTDTVTSMAGVPPLPGTTTGTGALAAKVPAPRASDP